MKNILGCFFIIITALSSCKKESTHAFDKSPDERINETISNYQSKLSGAQYGWKAVVMTDSGKGATYSFYFKFNDANRVVMYADFDSSSAVTAKESSYRLKALQQPSLIFDTYSYLHLLSDPNENTVTVQSDVNGFKGGALGQGLRSDFEFAIDTATTDSIKLTGRLHGSKAVLIRATQQEAAAYNNRGLFSGFLFKNLGKYLYYFKRITIGGIAYEINTNLNTRTINFSWLDASGNLQTFTTGFYYTVNGIEFANPFTNGSQIITGFRNITWDAATTTLAFSVNGTSTTVIGVPQPLKVDLGAPKRWYDFAANQQDVWVSFDGFHVNGIDDAFGVRALPGYRYMFYYPNYGSGYDWAGIVAATNYGPAMRATFQTNGTVKFTTPYNFGTIPTAATTTVTRIRTQFLEANGYYLVQTSPLSYDMVSALDGKAWISWEF